MAKPKRRKGESNKNYNLRLQAYRRRFDPEKAPRLLKNESPSSFKARVKAWETNTGKKYPTTFSGKSDEERILAGEVRLPGLGIKGKDFTGEYFDQIKEYQRTKPKISEEERNEQQIADIASGKTDLPTIDTTPLNAEQLRIDKIVKRQSKFDKQRLDDAREAENQEIRDQVALDKETDPWGIDNIRRAYGMEVGRTDTSGGALNIPKNVTSDKQDQSGMGKDVKPIGTYKSDTGNVTWGTDKKYPLTIGGKKTSQIQRKLIDAGHDPTKLAELMRIHGNKYGNRRFLGIGGK
jgi:hypothetical protein